MIKLQDMTPDVYYKDSRDFQFIGRLYDLVLNSVKTEADLMYSLPVSDNSNDQYLELLSLTLGFKAKHHYTTKQLRAICKVFPDILKHKGSVKAVIIACNALFNAEGLEQAMDYDFTKGKDKTELNLYIPEAFGDTVILNDLLSYVLPAGMSCNIVKELRVKETTNTDVVMADVFKLYSAGQYAAKNSSEGTKIIYDTNRLSKLFKVDDITFNYSDKSNTISAINYKAFNQGGAADKVSFICNGGVYRPNTTPPTRNSD